MRKFRNVLLLLCFIPAILIAAGQQGGQDAGAAAEMSGAATGGIEVWASLAEFEADGGSIGSFSQSPYLEGKGLPAVAERISDEPQVIRPYEQIGVYGGTARVFTKRPSPAEDGVGFISQSGILKATYDDSTFVPDVAKSYEWTADGKTITITLRKGMRWSDGDDFDTEDIRFWWEDVIMNDEITPVKPSQYKTSGKLCTVNIIDDVTFSFTFADPFPLFVHTLGHYAGVGLLLPSHYLKQFHIKYNKNADQMAKDAGYETWVQLYSDKATIYQGSIRCNHDVNVPTLFPYVMTDQGTDYWIFERNPYYWKVDSTGQQLPYIDRVYVSLASNVEMIDAKIISGEADWASFNTGLSNYTVYKENEDAGNYKTLLYSKPFGAFPVLQFNLTYAEDTVLRDIFKDVRWRQAMSVAINRDEINEALFFGRAIPRQNTVARSSAFFKPEFEDAYAQYDVDLANQLLDEMGLKWDSNKRRRLRPDGDPIVFTLEYTNIDASGAITAELEMIQKYWAAVGVNMQLKQQAGELLTERVLGNQLQAGMWTADKVTDILFPTDPMWFVPWKHAWGGPWATLWGQWYQTGGAEGEKPPAEPMKQIERWEKMKTTVDKAEQIRLGQAIMASQAENLWTIGTVGLPPVPVITRDNLMNVPAEGIIAWDNYWGQSYYPEQRFFKPPLYPSQK